MPRRSTRCWATPCPCSRRSRGCNWTFLYLGGWLFNGPGFEPTGEPLYQSGAPNNSGSYSDPKMDSLINATHTSSSLIGVPRTTPTTRRQQVPSLWMPWQTNGSQAVSNNLHNVTQNPLLTFYPEFWTCSTKTC